MSNEEGVRVRRDAAFAKEAWTPLNGAAGGKRRGSSLYCHPHSVLNGAEVFSWGEAIVVGPLPSPLHMPAPKAATASSLQHPAAKQVGRARAGSARSDED